MTVSLLTRAYAVALALAGAALVFAPELLAEGGAASIAQAFGAALFAFGAANWTARGMVLGGIYGRPLVVGNQAFALVAALVLVRHPPTPAGPALWVVVALLAAGAVLYSVLLYRPPAAAPADPAA